MIQSFKNWWHNYAAALNVALLSAWAALPQEMQAAFSPLTIKIAAIVLVLTGITGSLIKQKGPGSDAA